MFTAIDLNTFAQRGISPVDAQKQIELLRKGTQYVELHAPANVENGVFVAKETIQYYIDFYEKEQGGIDIIRFIPASGAASRMFKRLIDLSEKEKLSPEIFDYLLADDDFYSPGNTLRNIGKFAFSKELAHVLGLKYPFEISVANYSKIVDAIIKPSGLNYMNLPKGLLLFHEYGNKSRTPFEEHVYEGSLYAVGKCKCLRQHFTVSPEHLGAFKKIAEKTIIAFTENTDIKLEIDFSQQLPKTDTLAIDENGLPFRGSDGKLLFRPGGHGALIENLNSLDADLVFIKNIDNVVPDYLKQTTSTYKKLIAGILLEVKRKISDFLNMAEENTISDSDVKAMMIYAKNFLNIFPNETLVSNEAQLDFLKKKLNRPVRVCGMVKNTGEPGGGPFWVKSADGSESLQIIEKAQIDLTRADQKSVFEESTHFNPVDLVCWIKDYKGHKFDLLKYRDDATCFVASKTFNAKPLSALELPGLWNGAMADWITIFVEVPLATFNPVKEVNDLLREEHQPQI